MPSQLALDLDGAALRDQALDLLERTRAAYIAEALEWAHGSVDGNGDVTADDIHEVYPVPAGIDPRVLGAVLNPRHFKLLGYQQSRRRVNHARRIAVWGKK